MKKLFTVVAMAIMLCACGVTTSPLVDTSSKRLAQADGLYKATAKTVTEGVLKGTIKGENLVRVKVAMATARTALDVWTLAPNDPTAEQAAVLSLQAARTLLQSIAPKPQTRLAQHRQVKGYDKQWYFRSQPRRTFICSSISCSQAGLITSYRSRKSTHFSRSLSLRSVTYQ